MNSIRRFLQMAGATLALALLSVGGFGSTAAAAAGLPTAPVNNLALASASDVCDAINQVGSADCTVSNGNVVDNSNGSVTGIIRAVVSILSYLVGAVAIIMILIAAFKYMTSGGDSAKIGSAKSTLIYAMIGVAVAALAQVIVHFALSSATSANTPAASSSTPAASSPGTGSSKNSGQGGVGHPNL